MDRDTEDNAAGKCPVVHATRARANRDITVPIGTPVISAISR